MNAQVSHGLSDLAAEQPCTGCSEDECQETCQPCLQQKRVELPFHLRYRPLEVLRIGDDSNNPIPGLEVDIPDDDILTRLRVSNRCSIHLARSQVCAFAQQ